MRELNEMDELVLEKMSDYVPESYVEKQGKWIRDAHSGDYREIAYIEDIPLKPGKADQIANATAQEMASLSEEYELEDVSPLNLGGDR